MEVGQTGEDLVLAVNLVEGEGNPDLEPVLGLLHNMEENHALDLRPKIRHATRTNALVTNKKVLTT